MSQKVAVQICLNATASYLEVGQAFGLKSKINLVY